MKASSGSVIGLKAPHARNAHSKQDTRIGRCSRWTALYIRCHRAVACQMTQPRNSPHHTLRPDRKGTYSRMLRDESGDGPAEVLLAVQMQELRHRLRNHLQNMTSLISLQIGHARHAET